MTANRFTKMWIIANFVSLCMVPVFLVLGLLWDQYWGEIFRFAKILKLPLFFHIFYQGFYIGGLVALITLGILAVQIWEFRKERRSISAVWIAGEIFIIVIGILDLFPISGRLIGQLYYMIPGW